MNTTTKINTLALTMMPGLGDVNIKNILANFHVDELFTTPRGKLKTIPGIGERFIRSFEPEKFIGKAEEELKKTADYGGRLIFYNDPEFPKRLKNIPDAPFGLYVKGKGSIEAKRTIGIVGTRHATSYGREITERICAEAKPFGCQVISGLAYGIDIAAHREALDQNLSTLAVLGSGIDIIYPSAHRTTAMQLQEEGALISEQPMGTKPDAYNFPARNRIIAGLADIIIVVEAAQRGGALITAEIAYTYNREVFAVPGNLNQPYSAGCNQLIKQMKASIYTCFDDVAETMGWGESLKREKATLSIDFEKLTEDQQKIIHLLQENSQLTIDELSWRTQISSNKLASILLELEFSRLIKSLPGKNYRLAIQ